VYTWVKTKTCIRTASSLALIDSIPWEKINENQIIPHRSVKIEGCREEDL